MRNKHVVLTISMLMASFVASRAYAIDYCFNAAGEILVAPRFRVPSKGKCKVVVAHEGADLSTLTVCTNSAGTALRVGYSRYPGSLGSGDDGGKFEAGQMNMPLPLGSGPGVTAYRGISAGGVGFSGIGFASAEPCVPLVQPIP
jgi:hypothetical protein